MFYYRPLSTPKDLPPSTEPFYPNIYLRSQLCTKPQWPPSSTSVEDKVAIVTGSNTGLGLESSRQLLSYNLSHLIMAVRSIAKGEAAAAELRREYPLATIEVWQLDMTSYESIQKFVQRTETLPRLDIVILNAALGNLTFNIVKSTGHEEAMQVNYLSTVFLSILLLPVLKRKSPTGPGRLTIVSSGLALTVGIPTKTSSPLMTTFDNPKTYKWDTQYSMSKLLGHMFLYKLVDFVSADDVIVNLVDPGFTKGTELQRQASGLLSVVFSLAKLATARTVRDGACTYLDATVVKGKESHGCFLMEWKIQP
ncbi:short-chain dehydrogenase/reductase family protein [Aspergillus avenaceus]|uniref:Short-chain dehydrogenase/reductase family protein n=1 Tax=Aspergillus avenaceus TaxID=36643 RepID=A0A5N6TT85_ASPAV|nr:short-chain dehydrogenase/reductase family protein [Aspergillus avenaceus]